MNNRFLQGIIDSTLVVLVAIFLFMNIAGLPMHVMSMTMDEHGETQGCMFMGEAVMCQMNVLEHISSWQNIFAAVPNPAGVTLALILALCLILLRTNYFLPIERLTLFQLTPATDDLDVVSTDYLKQAFSQGTLHPKTY